MGTGSTIQLTYIGTKDPIYATRAKNYMIVLLKHDINKNQRVTFGSLMITGHGELDLAQLMWIFRQDITLRRNYPWQGTTDNFHEKQEASGHRSAAMLDVHDLSIPLVYHPGRDQ